MISPAKIKNELRIENIIAEYITIDRTENSNDLRCMCPFHEGDSNPSFSINVSKQVFYCFGCHTGGDVIRFIELIESINYTSAIELLAKKAGIDLELDQLTLLNEVRDYYHSNVNSIDYFLTHRKISSDMLKHYKFGYASSSNNTLVEDFSSNLELLELLGLIKIKYEGTTSQKVYNTMTNRFMIPIQSHLGTIALSGRTLIDDERKYLNLPDNKFFRKERTLFGFNDAARYIKSNDYAIVVEGFLDVARAFDNYYDNTVGVLGSYLTKNQALSIKRLTKNIFTAFDGDDPGYKATIHALKLSVGLGLNLNAIVMPPGEDPDSYLKNSSNKLENLDRVEFEDLVTKALTKEDILSIIKEHSFENIEPWILSHFKINPDIIKKRDKNNLLSSHKIKNLSKYFHLALIVDAFPDLIEIVPHDMIDKLEEQKSNSDFVKIIMEHNFYLSATKPRVLLLKIIGEINESERTLSNSIELYN